MTITLSTRARRFQLDAATDETRVAQLALREVLDRLHPLHSDEYVDARRAARDAEDRQDAAYLAWKSAEAEALAAWKESKPGDVVTMLTGLTGVIVNRGSIAGFIRPDGRENAVRVEVDGIWKIDRA